MQLCMSQRVKHPSPLQDIVEQEEAQRCAFALLFRGCARVSRIHARRPESMGEVAEKPEGNGTI